MDGYLAHQAPCSFSRIILYAHGFAVQRNEHASPAESHQYLPYRALDPAWTGDDRDDNLGSHVCTTRAQHVVC
ncbi:unnamed protein product [Zymoseptoria tritici ST99CH_1E4]|uniref:Uncharacterized protein n=1 Tax=Zymoseptoria tritici ST99CH_1E4 TaxID=1276532 RepID=A0A2H1GBB3_ZYMTR|nr:unnamed protein product [Zymoseptoria tritici ST99CH_1E4]